MEERWESEMKSSSLSTGDGLRKPAEQDCYGKKAGREGIIKKNRYQKRTGARLKN